MNRKNIVSIALALSLFSLALAQGGYSLKRVAKVGEEIKSAFTIEIKAGENAAKVSEDIEKGSLIFSASARSVDKVTAVAADGGYTYNSLTLGLKIKTPDGQEFPTEDETDGTNIVMNADRTVGKIESDDLDPAQMRMAILGTLKVPEKPVSIGDKWTAKIPANGENTYAAEGTYELLALEKVAGIECLKIKISIVEIGADINGKCEGTVWMDAVNFIDVKRIVTYTEVAFPQIPFPVNIELKEERS